MLEDELYEKKKEERVEQVNKAWERWGRGTQQVVV